MVWLFTSKSRTRRVAGGRSMEMDCPECRSEQTFVEVEVKTSAGVFFVDVVSDSERLWKCGGCGETFELQDEAAPAKAALASPPPARDLRAELERERAARDADAQRRDRQVDDELAALKKKLGK